MDLCEIWYCILVCTLSILYSRLIVKKIIFLTNFQTIFNINFWSNPSGGRIVLCGQTDRRDMTTLIISIRNFANKLKMS